MNKKIFKVGWILLTIFSVGLFAFPGQAAEYTFRYAHEHQPTHPQGIGAKCFKAAVEELTQGRVEVRLFPAAQLGNVGRLIDLVRIGSVEMSTNSIGAMASIVPEGDLFGLPFIFRDAEHTWKALHGPLRDILIKAYEKRGFHVFGLTISGGRQIFQKKPINSINDLKGSSIRVYEIPGIIECIKAIGARPVPLEYSEVYTAIQSGVVDGGETAFSAYIASKFFEVAKHIARVDFMENGRVFYMNKKYWEAFPSDIKKALEKAGRIHERVTQAAYESDEWLAIETLAKLGVKIYHPPIKPFIEAVQGVYDKLPPTLGKEWIKKIQEIE